MMAIDLRMSNTLQCLNTITTNLWMMAQRAELALILTPAYTSTDKATPPTPTLSFSHDTHNTKHSL